MGFSCYTDFGYPKYGDLGPPESHKDREIRTQRELIGKLQCRINELERKLSDALKQIERQSKIMEGL